MTNPQKSYQLPYVGGLLTGVGLGLWFFPVLINTGITKQFGMLGVIGVGLVLVFLGVAVGLPSRSATKDNEGEAK